MNGMSVAGRRGEVLWPTGTTVLGEGRQRTYDSFVVRSGFVVPFVLGETVHIWAIPLLRGAPCKALRLRDDPAFKRRVLMSNWTGAGAIALLIAPLILWGKIKLTPLVIGVFIVAAVGLAAAHFLCFGERNRHRSIRLLLGPHEWGSSDPATWHEDVVKDVLSAQVALGADSYAALSERALQQDRWCEAMWGARLCAAVEDQQRGEALTDAILRKSEVIERLQRVARRLESRDQEFGLAISLRRFISCAPEKHIAAIN